MSFTKGQDQLADLVEEVFLNQVPFHRLLGVKVGTLKAKKASVKFSMQEKLVGNPAHNMLHGGVIASVLDAVGGLLVMVNLLKSANGQVNNSKKPINFSTVDMRVDFLRPGIGKHFVAKAKIIKQGNKICVTQMSLHNEHKLKIAQGIASYIAA